MQPHSQRYLKGQNQSQILQVQPERNSFDIDTIENIFPIKLIENALKMLQVFKCATQRALALRLKYNSDKEQEKYDN